MNFLEARNAKNHRVAVTVTRKHDKRAVARNRYRRGLYDALLPFLKSPFQGGADVGGGGLASASVSKPPSSTQHANPLERGTGAIVKNPSTKVFLCVFTLKKGLKLTEKKIPDAWITDARKLFEKATQPPIKNEQPPRSL